MQKHLEVAKRFLLLTASAIATSLTTATPSQAASIASSQVGFDLTNFSVNPLNCETFVNTNTEAFSIKDRGQVYADLLADANCNILPNPSETFADNISLTQATAEGEDYFGIAESLTSVEFYNFQVDAEETFSFDFTGDLSLETSVDKTSTGKANANGIIEVLLYDQKNGKVLDTLLIAGNVATSDNSNDLIYNKSENFSFDPTKTSFETEFSSIKNNAYASVEGSYSRKFTEDANLSLFQLISNRASVTVPEPTSNFAIVFGTVAIFVIAKAKRQATSSKITNL